MRLSAGTKLCLRDNVNRRLGEVDVERVDGDLVLGQFAGDSAFTVHEELFRQFEDAANSQALPLVEELESKIANLGLSVVDSANGSTIQADDVQIWRDGGISIRLGVGVAEVQRDSAG